MGEAEKTISLYEVTVQHGILLVSNQEPIPKLAMDRWPEVVRVY